MPNRRCFKPRWIDHALRYRSPDEPGHPANDNSLLEAAGFVTMTDNGRRKIPQVSITKILVEIDPCSDNDSLRVA